MRRKCTGKGTSHFLQPYSGMLILTVKTKPLPDTDQVEAKKTYTYDPHIDPSLQWAGKAERGGFEAPTVSLHVHERIDPRSILEAVRKTLSIPRPLRHVERELKNVRAMRRFGRAKISSPTQDIYRPRY